MKYRNFDTNEIWTEEEIKEIYDHEKDLQIHFKTFEKYLEYLLDLGRQQAGGIVVERW